MTKISKSKREPKTKRKDQGFYVEPAGHVVRVYKNRTARGQKILVGIYNHKNKKWTEIGKIPANFKSSVEQSQTA